MNEIVKIVRLLIQKHNIVKCNRKYFNEYITTSEQTGNVSPIGWWGGVCVGTIEYIMLHFFNHRFYFDKKWHGRMFIGHRYRNGIFEITKVKISANY